MTPTLTDAKTEVAAIRKELRRLVPGISVRNGRGTAYGWVDISGSLPSGEFTPEQHKQLHAVGIGTCANVALIAPENRTATLARLQDA